MNGALFEMFDNHVEHGVNHVIRANPPRPARTEESRGEIVKVTSTGSFDFAQDDELPSSAFVSESIDCKFQIFPRMRSTDLSANAGSAMRHHR